MDPFTDHRAAGRALLQVEGLAEKEGQFLGGLCYRDKPLTERQARWLGILLQRHGLPPFAGEVADA
jgi:hypothetical protein